MGVIIKRMLEVETLNPEPLGAIKGDATSSDYSSYAL